MRRLFWIGVGITLTVMVVVKGQQMLQKLTPAGMSEQVQERASSVMAELKERAQTFSEAMKEREAELSAEFAAQQAAN